MTEVYTKTTEYVNRINKIKMPPKPDTSEIPSSSAEEQGENKPPFKERMRIGFTNFIASSRLFIYNKEHQTVFGNTSSSWIKISVYYFFFYVCLGLFYSGMVAVFGAIVSRESPTYWYTNNRMNDGGQVYIGLF